MARDPLEARADSKIDALKDEIDALMAVVVNLKVAATLCPESADRIGHHLGLVHRHLGRVTAKAQDMHGVEGLAVGVFGLLRDDRGGV